MTDPNPSNGLPARPGAHRLLGVGTYFRRALRLVWAADRGLTAWLAVASLIAGTLPVGVAYVGKLVIDSVLVAVASGNEVDKRAVLLLLGVELALVTMLLGAYRALRVCEALLRVKLGQHVTELVLEKALTLELADFESAEVQDRLDRVRREAAIRPLGLVRGALSTAQEGMTLAGFGVILFGFSPWLFLILVVGALPAIVAEARFSADAFRLFRAHTPEARRQDYLETLVTRSEPAKEVRVLDAGARLVDAHRRIFERHYAADRRLTIKRGAVGFALAALSAITLAASYAWVAWSAVDRRISVGDMAMLFIVLKQAQSIVAIVLMSVAGMYEDNLYLSTLHEILDHPVASRLGTARAGTVAGDGLRFESVSFTYPDRTEPALSDVSFRIAPGEKVAIVGANAAGKSTLAKLAAGLYEPTSGRVERDGTPLAEWDRTELHRRTGILFQDYVQYHLSAGENIGLGDASAHDDERRWEIAARAASVHDDLVELPRGYRTQLGRWFPEGVELSLGQWQRVALARLFMRGSADLVVLDEPTARLDAAAEQALLERLRDLPENVSVLLISHRLSTARVADRIIVLERGRIVEEGSHDELVAARGRYAGLATRRAEDGEGEGEAVG